MGTAPVMIVDPHEYPELLELAALAGVAAQRHRVWPFEVPQRARIASTIPVPRPFAARVLGVIGPLPTEPAAVGDEWPVRTVTLADEVEIVAHLAGNSDPYGSVIALAASRGGIGLTTLAAALARTLAADGHVVALIDPQAGSPLHRTLDLPTGITWSGLAAEANDGVLLPNRLEARLPEWEGVHVLTAGSGASGPGPNLLHAVHALRCIHDVVVLDLGQHLHLLEELRPDLWIPLVYGTAAEVRTVAHYSARVPARCVPVVRLGGPLSALEVAARLGRQVTTMRADPAAALALAHGCKPGDDTTSAVTRAARRLATECVR